MKDIDNDTLKTYWMFFAGSSFNAYFILEELAKRRDKGAFQWLASAYGDGLKYAREFEVHVEGTSDDLEKLYCRLDHLFCKEVPANADIPVEKLFDELVGGGEYAGVIHSVGRVHDVIFIRVYTEGNTNRFAIAYAIQQAFPTLRVDWEHLRKQ